MPDMQKLWALVVVLLVAAVAAVLLDMLPGGLGSGPAATSEEDMLMVDGFAEMQHQAAIRNVAIADRDTVIVAQNHHT